MLLDPWSSPWWRRVGLVLFDCSMSCLFSCSVYSRCFLHCSGGDPPLIEGCGLSLYYLTGFYLVWIAPLDVCVVGFYYNGYKKDVTPVPPATISRGRTVIFDIVEYITMEWTMPNQSRICRLSRRILILQTRRRVLLASLSQSSIGQKRIT
jgi:hypothetical protein